MVETVTDPETGKKRVVHTPKKQPVMVMNRNASGAIMAATANNTTNAEPAPEPAVESRQVRRANARRAEKRIRQHMNEVVLKKNKKRG